MPRSYSELVCTDLHSVELAVRLGADRIELCAALEVGGVTPGPGLLAEALRLVEGRLAVVVLIRPRAGDFVVRSSAERSAILADIAHAKETGADGVAVGALDADGLVDVPLMRAAVGAAGGLDVTFHRAIDAAADIDRAAESLAALGVRRVLTSGGEPTAWEGRTRIAGIVSRLGDALEVIAAGGVTGANAAAILRETGARAVHGSCLGASAAPVSPGMGSGRRMDADLARGLVAAARGASGA